MTGQGGTRIRVTLRWLQILDNLEPFFKEKGEFVFWSKVITDNHGGKVEERRMPAKGHYSISDRPRWNRLKNLDKVLFEGEVSDHLVVELRGEELDQFSANDQLDTYRRTFTGPIGSHVAKVQPGDEGSDDPETCPTGGSATRSRRSSSPRAGIPTRGHARVAATRRIFSTME